MTPVRSPSSDPKEAPRSAPARAATRAAKWVADLIARVNNMILAIAATVAAIAAIVGVADKLGSGAHRSVTPKTSIGKIFVGGDLSREAYEQRYEAYAGPPRRARYRQAPGGSARAEAPDGSEAVSHGSVRVILAHFRLAAYTTPAPLRYVALTGDAVSSRGRVAGAGASSDGSAAESTSTTTTSTTSPGAATGPPATVTGTETTATGSGTSPSGQGGSVQSQGAPRRSSFVVAKGAGVSSSKVSEVLNYYWSPPSPLPPPSSLPGSSTSLTETSTSPETLESGPPPSTAGPPRRCDHCAGRPIVEQALAASHNNVAEAARKLRAAAGEWRALTAGGTPQWIGVPVHYTLDISGYAGRWVKVQYSISTRGRHRLPPVWWNHEVLIRRTLAKGSEVSAPERFWAPIPQEPGDYFIELELVGDKGEELDIEPTKEFD
jgi:hypothetical protein